MGRDGEGRIMFVCLKFTLHKTGNICSLTTTALRLFRVTP